jgi:hypothetical protein
MGPPPRAYPDARSAAAARLSQIETVTVNDLFVTSV